MIYIVFAGMVVCLFLLLCRGDKFSISVQFWLAVLALVLLFIFKVLGDMQVR